MIDLVAILVVILGLTAYGSAVWQMLNGDYSPSFFSRGVWFLLGINSFAGVYLGGGSKTAVLLAATLLIGNTAVFILSYKKDHARLVWLRKSAWYYSSPADSPGYCLMHHS